MEFTVSNQGKQVLAWTTTELILSTHKNSDRKQYRHNIKAPTSSSFNPYKRESSEHCGNINSVIPTQSRKYVPMITESSRTITSISIQAYLFWKFDNRKQNGLETSYTYPVICKR